MNVNERASETSHDHHLKNWKYSPLFTGMILFLPLLIFLFFITGDCDFRDWFPFRGKRGNGLKWIFFYYILPLIHTGSGSDFNPIGLWKEKEINQKTQCKKMKKGVMNFSTFWMRSRLYFIEWFWWAAGLSLSWDFDCVFIVFLPNLFVVDFQRVRGHWYLFDPPLDWWRPIGCLLPDMDISIYWLPSVDQAVPTTAIIRLQSSHGRERQRNGKNKRPGAVGDFFDCRLDICDLIPSYLSPPLPTPPLPP